MSSVCQKMMESCDDKNRKSSLSIRAFIGLRPHPVDRFSAAFPPLIRRLLAGYPHVIPQIFRAFSASFAHRIGLVFFRRLCAAISEEIADCAEKKKGEKKANGLRLRKSVQRRLYSPGGGSFPPRAKSRPTPPPRRIHHRPASGRPSPRAPECLERRSGAWPQSAARLRPRSFVRR